MQENRDPRPILAVPHRRTIELFNRIEMERKGKIMPTVQVGVDRLRVHKAGEGHAYWQMTFVGVAAEGGFGNYAYLWDWDDGTSDFTYNIGPKWLFILKDKEKIRITMFGQEVDTTSPNDPAARCFRSRGSDVGGPELRDFGRLR
jgi:hypothetical protein